MEPIYHRIPLSDFDIGRLPADARTPGTPAFNDAVLLTIAMDYAQKGEMAVVTVDESEITVMSFPGTDAALEYILQDLRSGRIAESIPKLESLAKADPNNVDVLFNLGLAYSETGQFDEAIIRLKKVVRLAPSHAHAWTAIGVAYQRMGRPDQSIEPFEKAIAVAPDDGHALRNLGGSLLARGRAKDAIPILRRALAALSDDVHSRYGLAQALLDGGDPNDRRDAAAEFRHVIASAPASPIAELARQGLTKIAESTLRDAAPGGLRPDVLHYIQDALELLRPKSDREIKELALELARLGESGLDINDPTRKYTLSKIPGEFTGLRIVSLMYTAFRAIDPKIDIGLDFSREYEMAVALQGGTSSARVSREGT